MMLIVDDGLLMIIVVRDIVTSAVNDAIVCRFAGHIRFRRNSYRRLKERSADEYNEEDRAE